MIKLSPKLKNKKLVVFDLDGTLAESKSALLPDMGRLLCRLLTKKRVAIIGGGKYEQFQKQFLSSFHCSPKLLTRLFLFPTSSTAFYRYQNRWKRVYSHVLPRASRTKIFKAFNRALAAAHFVYPKKIYGKLMEDRGTQVTFSALGQKAPVHLKEAWNKKHDLRVAIMRFLQKDLPEFEVRRGGLTSLDVTKKGIDKAYGIRQIKKVLHISISEMLFIGDALYLGGNDYAARKTGVTCVQVVGPIVTKRVIAFLLGS